MFSKFQTTTYGKWVLAGEHAVLRGHGAIAFPLKEKKLNLSYSNHASILQTEFSGSSGQHIEPVFQKLLEQALELSNHPKLTLHGSFHLTSNIPIGRGLGASAALSLALSRWFAAQDLIETMRIYAFARELENLFHGKSSGLDIYAVDAKAGIYFQEGKSSPIQQTWQPIWYLSDSGSMGITLHCIQQVQTLWQKEPKYAKKIDDNMQAAVNKALQALKTDNNSQTLLQESMEEAYACFKDWGLITHALDQHMQALKNLGAIAVKPTGSGGGGYVLSLWDKPPKEPLIEFIAL